MQTGHGEKTSWQRVAGAANVDGSPGAVRWLAFTLGACRWFQRPATVHSGSSPAPPVQRLGVALPHGPSCFHGCKNLVKTDENLATPRAQHQAGFSFWKILNVPGARSPHLLVHSGELANTESERLYQTFPMVSKRRCHLPPTSPTCSKCGDLVLEDDFSGRHVCPENAGPSRAS